MNKQIDLSKLRIGRGKNMSIAKAGLVFFYNQAKYNPDNADYPVDFLHWGDLYIMHIIVDIAGAKQISVITASQVSGCLANSPYWDKELHPSFYPGFPGGQRTANMYTPSEKGKEYYEKHLKGKFLPPYKQKEGA